MIAAPDRAGKEPRVPLEHCAGPEAPLRSEDRQAWRSSMRLSALVALAILLAPAARAEVIVEKDSGQEFPATLTLNDPSSGEAVSLRATGTGLRKKAWFKVYAACFYVRSDVELGEDPYASFIADDYEKVIVMRFLRDVGADKIANAFREGIRKTLPEGHDEALDAFLGLFTAPVQNGQELTLSYTPGGGLEASQEGRPLGSLDDPAVIAALWATWFGDEPISKDLKQGLAGL